jgi:hypothetical protein
VQEVRRLCGCCCCWCCCCGCMLPPAVTGTAATAANLPHESIHPTLLCTSQGCTCCIAQQSKHSRRLTSPKQCIDSCRFTESELPCTCWLCRARRAPCPACCGVLPRMTTRGARARSWTLQCLPACQQHRVSSGHLHCQPAESDYYTLQRMPVAAVSCKLWHEIDSTCHCLFCSVCV